MQPTHLAQRAGAVLSPHNNCVGAASPFGHGLTFLVSMLVQPEAKGCMWLVHGQHPPGLIAPCACSDVPSPNISMGLWLSVSVRGAAGDKAEAAGRAAGPHASDQARRV